ncbi:protein kinase domain-containing protein [Amycolatopsis sulphurea]|uniref:protein kinase domain-containing protein n=1 Tax=Amycolatopsis sulphurea TaxID=76022 RepID=UPI001FE39B39|nr:hypothetical protein [Amycolatopsis sulphurea]
MGVVWRALDLELGRPVTLKRSLGEDGPLTEARVRRTGASLADRHARGIVHRDVKPGNVLVASDDVAKLTDLGIARWTEVTRAAAPSSPARSGTSHRKSPTAAKPVPLRTSSPSAPPVRRDRRPLAVGLRRGRSVRADPPRGRRTATARDLDRQTRRTPRFRVRQRLSDAGVDGLRPEEVGEPR